MATITITRKFTDFPDTSTAMLVSVHLPTSMEFEFDRGIEVNTYAKVEINGISFFATKTATVGNVDTYIIDCSDIFKYILGIPDFDPFLLDKLTAECNVVCKGYDSLGNVIATATHDDFWLCNAISASPVDGLSALYEKGRTNTGNIYFTRWLYYFDKATKKYVYVYNPPTGLYDTGDFTINIVNVPELSENVKSISFINEDGCFDRCDFTILQTESKNKKSNPMSLYANELYKWNGYEFNLQNDIEETVTLKTIALNSEHYAQLYYITMSPLIIDSNTKHIYELESPPAPIASCKQNLNFTLTLKRKYYAQSY